MEEISGEEPSRAGGKRKSLQFLISDTKCDHDQASAVVKEHQ